MSKIVHQKITEALSKAAKFNWDDVLVRYAEKFRYSPRVVDLHARELIRFLTLASIAERQLPMEGPVDALWHEFVLHSELYASFCKTTTGRFVHHQPSKPVSTPEEESAAAAEWAEFSRLYQEAFGEAPPAEVWPATDRLDTGSREWWKRRLEQVAGGSETQAWWWSTSSSGSGDITYCNTNDTTSSSASDTCTSKSPGTGGTG